MTRIEKNKVVLKRKRMLIATTSLIIIFFLSIIILCIIGKPGLFSTIAAITLISSMLLGLIFTMYLILYSNQLDNYRREIQKKREAILLKIALGYLDEKPYDIEKVKQISTIIHEQTNSGILMGYYMAVSKNSDNETAKEIGANFKKRYFDKRK